MKYRLLLCLFSVGVVAGVYSIVVPSLSDLDSPFPPGNEKFKPTWKSLSRHSVPKWLCDAKFGIWTHWGVYAVPAYGDEWYPRKMYSDEKFTRYHKEHFGRLDEFGYHDFVPMFKAGNFDADRWAELFKKAGARFAGPVAEHHDGFAMWDSKLTDWDTVDKGPGRDIVGELARSIRERGMKFVTSFHHLRRWWYYEPSYTPGDKYYTKDSRYAGEYGLYPPGHNKGATPSRKYIMSCEKKIIEVIDKYQPAMLFFDSGPGFGSLWKSRQKEFDECTRRYLAYYYNKASEWGNNVTVVYEKGDISADPADIGIQALERHRMNQATDQPWITVTSVDKKSWGYIQNPKYETVDTLVDVLVDIVSKNGILWLNIGPKANGTIPERQKELLLGIGRWLEVNGEAIYGTRPWKTATQGQEIRFTCRKDKNAVYVICLKWPCAGLHIQSLGSDSTDIEDITLLGYKGGIKWSQGEKATHVHTPEYRPCKHAYVFKVQFGH